MGRHATAACERRRVYDGYMMAYYKVEGGRNTCLGIPYWRNLRVLLPAASPEIPL